MLYRMKITNQNPDPTSQAVPRRIGRTHSERIAQSKTAILDCAIELLVERGYAGTTVDEIARRSGVAKTTIYRHWPKRSELLRDACLQIGTPMQQPLTGQFEQDLKIILRDLASQLNTAKWTAVLPSILDAAERDAEMAAMYSVLQKDYSAGLQHIFSNAKTQGKLAAETDIPALIAMSVGPLFYRRWFSREACTDEFVEQLIARILPCKSDQADGPVTEMKIRCTT